MGHIRLCSYTGIDTQADVNADAALDITTLATLASMATVTSDTCTSCAMATLGCIFYNSSLIDLEAGEADKAA